MRDIFETIYNAIEQSDVAFTNKLSEAETSELSAVIVEAVLGGLRGESAWVRDDLRQDG